MKSAKKMLKKVRNNIYVTKKLNAVNYNKKAQHNSCNKNMLHFRIALTT
nr:hypothetical protein [Wolbachia endosymbiont of Litomosoides sigmodontis]